MSANATTPAEDLGSLVRSLLILAESIRSDLRYSSTPPSPPSRTDIDSASDAAAHLSEVIAATASQPLAELLQEFRRACDEAAEAEAGRANCVASAALTAGLAFGAFAGREQHLIGEEVRQSLARVHAPLARKRARSSLVAAERKARLRDYAVAARKADPHISASEIARNFRALHRPSPGTSANTNLEEKELRALVREGALPARLARYGKRDGRPE